MIWMSNDLLGYTSNDPHGYKSLKHVPKEESHPRSNTRRATLRKTLMSTRLYSSHDLMMGKGGMGVVT